MGSNTKTTDQSGTAPISAATIADIRTRIARGSRILASDMQTIRNALASWNAHTHTYFDQVSLFDFGNVDGGSSSQTLTSGGAGTYSVTSPSGQVRAIDVNGWNAACRGFQNHVHDHSA